MAWLLDGTRVRAERHLASVPAGWTFVDALDLDGDGTSDLLWSHVDGTMLAWKLGRARSPRRCRCPTSACASALRRSPTAPTTGPTTRRGLRRRRPARPGVQRVDIDEGRRRLLVWIMDGFLAARSEGVAERLLHRGFGYDYLVDGDLRVDGDCRLRPAVGPACGRPPARSLLRARRLRLVGAMAVGRPDPRADARTPRVPSRCTPGDFDGDGIDDVLAQLPAGPWVTWRVRDATVVQSWWFNDASADERIESTARISTATASTTWSAARRMRWCCVAWPTARCSAAPLPDEPHAVDGAVTGPATWTSVRRSP